MATTNESLPVPGVPGTSAADGVIGQFAALLRGLRGSQRRRRIGLLAAGVVLVICANVVGQILLIRWQGAFYDAIEQKLLPSEHSTALSEMLERDPSSVYEHVAQLVDKPVAEHGNAWEHVALYQSPIGAYCIAGQGGPESDRGRKYGANVGHRESLTPEQAQVLLTSRAK